MNYIHELQRENAALKARLKSKDDAAIAFILYLRSPKFQSRDPGQNNGHIATEDVINWLIETNAASIHAEENAAADWKPKNI